MGKANVFGPSSGGATFFDAVYVDFDDETTWPIVSDIMPMEHYDALSVQLVSGGARDIEVLDGDEVVESTRTWTLKTGNFSQNDVGGSFTVAGSAEGNDATYTIESVTNAFTVVSVESPADDEEFDPDEVTVSLIQTSPQGDWEFSISNSYSPGTGPTAENDGSPWYPFNSQFSPAIKTVDSQFAPDTANSAHQFVQAAPFRTAGVKLRFTPTSGAGPVSAYLCAGGNR